MCNKKRLSKRAKRKSEECTLVIYKIKDNVTKFRVFKNIDALEAYVDNVIGLNYESIRTINAHLYVAEV